MPGPPADGAGGKRGVGGGGWGHINIQFDVNMNIDIHITINTCMNIEYWLYPIGYSLLATPYWLTPIGYSLLSTQVLDSTIELFDQCYSAARVSIESRGAVGHLLEPRLHLVEAESPSGGTTGE